MLARILTDRGLQTSRLGAMALACAAVNDVTAWCLLAVAVSVANARAGSAVATVAATAAHVAAMLCVVRPVVAGLVKRHEADGRLTRGVLGALFAGVLLSASATEAIGVHALFGAFLLGAIIPHDSALAREVTTRLEDVVLVLLLPAFFAFTGLRTELGLVGGLREWLLCGTIILAASAGKFGGAFAAARLTGIARVDAAALGVLMNTRGLMELVVLNVGLDPGVISPALFAMLVVMALATTLATTPVLDLLARARPPAAARAGAA